MGRWPRLVTRDEQEAAWWTYVLPTEGCWHWTGALNSNGYGVARVGGKTTTAQRAAYIYRIGPIPDGMTVDHLCKNRSCVNPEHLELVSFKDNVLRGSSFSAVNAQKETCNRGHRLVDEGNRRRCFECAAESARRRYLARKHTAGYRAAAADRQRRYRARKKEV